MLPTPIVSVVDPKRLTQVVVNLVVNALNYSPAGQTVTIQLEADAENAVIHVIDTGLGIAPENLMHIFEPFFRANPEANIQGTGLGLSISKTIIEMHGGTLTVESVLGKGSDFTIRLARKNEQHREIVSGIRT